MQDAQDDTQVAGSARPTPTSRPVTSPTGIPEAEGHGENDAFDFDDPNDVTDEGHAHGLSPLALGILLGMLLLAGSAGWLVLQSRLDNLEAQFGLLDERLQVVLGDARRQGEALRTYLADPNPARPVPAPSAQESDTPSTDDVATLQRQLATQTERVAALEKRLANQDAALAELDRRAGQLEKRPLAAANTPKVAPKSAPTRERDVTPVEPQAGYVVVLASLPVREQALQELDNLRSKGLSVVLREARIKNATWYRIQAEGFRDRDSATTFARTAETRHGVAGAWVVAP